MSQYYLQNCSCGVFFWSKIVTGQFFGSDCHTIGHHFFLAVIFKIEILLSKHVSALKTLYFRPLKEFPLDLEIFALFSYWYVQNSQLSINSELGCVFTFFILVMGEFGNWLRNLQSEKLSLESQCEVRKPIKAFDEPIFKYSHELRNLRSSKLRHFQIR